MKKRIKKKNENRFKRIMKKMRQNMLNDFCINSGISRKKIRHLPVPPSFYNENIDKYNDIFGTITKKFLFEKNYDIIL